MRKYLAPLIFLISLITILFSCNKPIIKYDGVLDFSEDTLMFDTVFTTQGSSLRTLKVFNNTDEQLVISSISVSNGQYSQYNINVNGVSGYIFEDVEIEPHDSMYIFAQVRIDPNNINTPLIVEDSICFRMEKTEQYVKLLAWGQDANYIIADTYQEGLPPYKIVAGEGEVTVWNSHKPYVVMGYAVIDSVGQLIVEAGTRVHFHSNGGIWVYKGGSIKVLGTPDNKVVFEGDRLEPQYDSIPGQWEKIWINEGSINNEFHNAVIKNGLVGIHSQTLDEPLGNALILNNVEIHSMSRYGIYSMNYTIFAGNCVVSNCKEQLAILSMGGDYDFRNCTFANYNKNGRESSAVYVSNVYLDLLNNIFFMGNLNAYFGNCIIYGIKDNEFNVGVNDNVEFNCTVENSLVRIGDKEFDYLSEYLVNCVRNQTPLFKDSLMLDYRLDTITSPAVNAGSISIINESPLLDITRDFSGNSRISDEAPDIGAFEFVDQ
ncbi:hypothetical protein LJC25_02070 [Bacteroidales bacterium OttesenSCG-928-K03]|nr:hypothetical protein [Bacteroidales bacterium OttesenSCG-928-L14]MDL2240342.1 hypothetical protein [Bacteroidales bacterium OttesenSCG-928-K22]MDL2242495.1 hypothetical protein [Bacteroidales bacterium OttesenSCG-928-K03]